MIEFPYEEAIVCFHAQGNHWLDRWLHKEYRHCFVVVLSGDYWIMLDPTMHGPEIKVVADKDNKPDVFYQNCGYKVVSLDLKRKLVVYPMTLSNCVGVVKAVLSIQKPFIFTPYQLWRHLT